MLNILQFSVLYNILVDHRDKTYKLIVGQENILNK